jgi:hypothetical protein
LSSAALGLAQRQIQLSHHVTSVKRQLQRIARVRNFAEAPSKLRMVSVLSRELTEPAAMFGAVIGYADIDQQVR